MFGFCVDSERAFGYIRDMANTRSSGSLRIGIALFVLIGGLLIGLLAPRLGATDEPSVQQSHVVQRGETLWQLAADHSTGDPRKFIHQVQVLNGLKTSSIFPGQRLILPSG